MLTQAYKELQWVGPVDNRTSNDRHHHFVKQQINNNKKFTHDT